MRSEAGTAVKRTFATEVGSCGMSDRKPRSVGRLLGRAVGMLNPAVREFMSILERSVGRVPSLDVRDPMRSLAF